MENIKQTKKCLRFLETLKDDKETIYWAKDEEYEVVFEADDHYLLPAQNGVKCGIDKKSEGNKYIVVYREVSWDFMK